MLEDGFVNVKCKRNKIEETCKLSFNKIYSLVTPCHLRTWRDIKYTRSTYKPGNMHDQTNRKTRRGTVGSTSDS